MVFVHKPENGMEGRSEVATEQSSSEKAQHREREREKKKHSGGWESVRMLLIIFLQRVCFLINHKLLDKLNKLKLKILFNGKAYYI